MPTYQSKYQYWKTRTGGKPTLGGGATRRFYRSQKTAPKKRQYTSSRFQKVRPKYVDAFYNKTAIAEFSDAVDDDWAGMETNPSDTVGVIGCMPMPLVGDGYYARDDRRIFVKSIKIRGYINWDLSDTLTSATGSGFVRLVFVKDTQTNGATLDAENVIGGGFDSSGAACISGDGGGVNFFTDPEGWSRYKIMRDFTIRAPPQPVFNDGTDGAQQEMRTPFKITVKSNCYVNFSGNTGKIGSIIDNSFHLLTGKSGIQGAASLCYYVRTSFNDA